MRTSKYSILAESKIKFGFLSPDESAQLINQSKIVIEVNKSWVFDDNTFFNANSNKLPAISINLRNF